jgi:hypothetical protein
VGVSLRTQCIYINRFVWRGSEERRKGGREVGRKEGRKEGKERKETGEEGRKGKGKEKGG